MSASVLYTYDGKEISEDNPLPVKMAGGVDDSALEDYYTKEEADNKYQEKGDYATTSQVDSKADKSALEALQDTVADLQAELEELKGDVEE